MRIEHVLSATLVAALAGVSSFAAIARGTSVDVVSGRTSDLIVRASVLTETAEPVAPGPTNTVILASNYTYRLRVRRVINGRETRPEITATWVRDGALLRNRDFLFHLTRKPDGSYEVQSLDRTK